MTSIPEGISTAKDCGFEEDDVFADFYPGRRLQFCYPLPSLQDTQSEVDHNAQRIAESQNLGTNGNNRNPTMKSRTESSFSISGPALVVVTTLDAPVDRDVLAPCAAMIVPMGKENDWVYVSEGGQWQLQTSAGVGRLIIISRCLKRAAYTSVHDGFVNPDIERDISQGSVVESSDQLSNLALPETFLLNVSDVTLQGLVRKLVISLAPRACFESMSSLHFLTYADNVIDCVVVEEALSPFSGRIVVEDVELDLWESGVKHNSEYMKQVREDELRDGDVEKMEVSSEKFCFHKKRRQSKGKSVFRRRMRFERMPNLIQSEVPLEGFHEEMGSTVCTQGVRGKVSLKSISDELKRPDYSRLVHKYLPPIIAGFPLIGKSLFQETSQPKVLIIGGGAFTLPIFLHRHLPLEIHVVEIDSVVTDLAKRHFGLEEDKRLFVHTCDGLAFVKDLASALDEGVSAPMSSEQRADHQRYHMIIIDVDEVDGRSSLSSPPSCFLEQDFLQCVKKVLHEYGLLAVNIVPCSKKAYRKAIRGLKSVFEDVFESNVDDDVNFVAYALPARVQMQDLDEIVEMWGGLVPLELMQKVTPVRVNKVLRKK